MSNIKLLTKIYLPFIEHGLSNLVFVVSINSYDQYNEEGINDLSDSLRMYKSLTSNILLKSKSFVVLFNKMDLFEKKLLFSRLSVHFSEYKVTDLKDQDLRSAKKFFKLLFENAGHEHLIGLQKFHFTTMTDTEAIGPVIGRRILTSIINTSIENASVL